MAVEFNEQADRRRRAKAVFLVVFLFVLLVTVGIVSSTMFFNVGVGEVALIVDPITRSISDPVVGPAWSFKAPWAYTAKIYYATDSYEDTIPCFSKDQLEAQITVLLRWQLDISKIRELYRNFPRLDYESVTIDSITEETIRFVTKEYTAVETVENRPLIAQRIQEEIFGKIEESAMLANALINLEFDLKNIGYPAKYTSAIEDKLISEQKKIQADFERERILILANATAQEVLIKASAEAQSKILVAEGTRQAIENIMRSAGLTNSTEIAELYLWVEALKQLNVNSYIIVAGAEGVPFIYQIPANTTRTP